MIRHLKMKFRVRLTIGVVVPSKYPDAPPDQEVVEHVCAYECDVRVDKLDALVSLRLKDMFKAAALKLVNHSEADILSRINGRT